MTCSIRARVAFSRRLESRPWQVIPSGRGSSTRRRSSTLAAASSSPSSRARSPSQRRRAAGTSWATPSLGLAVQKAKDASMPKDNIERAIAKGTGEGADTESYRGRHVRGLRPRRRGDAGRGADRQPQPHRLRGPPRVRQARRQPRRARLGRLPLRQEGRRGRRRREVLRGRPDARAGRRRRGHRRRRRRVRDPLRAVGPHRDARGAGRGRDRGLRGVRCSSARRRSSRSTRTARRS